MLEASSGFVDNQDGQKGSITGTYLEISGTRLFNGVPAMVVVFLAAAQAGCSGTILGKFGGVKIANPTQRKNNCNEDVVKMNDVRRVWVLPTDQLNVEFGESGESNLKYLEIADQ